MFKCLQFGVISFRYCQRVALPPLWNKKPRRAALIGSELRFIASTEAMTVTWRACCHNFTFCLRAQPENACTWGGLLVTAGSGADPVPFKSRHGSMVTPHTSGFLWGYSVADYVIRRGPECVGSEMTVSQGCYAQSWNRNLIIQGHACPLT